MRYALGIIMIIFCLPFSLLAEGELESLSTSTKEIEEYEVSLLSLLPPISYPSLEHTSHLTRFDQQAASKLKTWKPNSTYALLWSILPGGGQIYNRKYWKVPLVWGALMGAFYAINWNQRLYSEYHAAYRDIKSEDPSKNTAWLAFAPSGTKPEDYGQMSRLTNTLSRGNDYYRRYRDLSIVVGILVYGLSILDAYVDAELYSFDISPDLSMRVSPVVLPPMPSLSPTAPNPYQVGLVCSFTF